MQKCAEITLNHNESEAESLAECQLKTPKLFRNTSLELSEKQIQYQHRPQDTRPDFPTLPFSRRNPMPKPEAGRDNAVLTSERKTQWTKQKISNAYVRKNRFA